MTTNDTASMWAACRKCGRDISTGYSNNGLCVVCAEPVVAEGPDVWDWLGVKPIKGGAQDSPQDAEPAMPPEAWLAEKATGWTPFRHHGDGFWYVGLSEGGVMTLPLPPYTDANAWLVLTWLAKAGYAVEVKHFNGDPAGYAVNIARIPYKVVVGIVEMGRPADTPEAALATAVAALAAERE